MLQLFVVLMGSLIILIIGINKRDADIIFSSILVPICFLTLVIVIGIN